MNYFLRDSFRKLSLSAADSCREDFNQAGNQLRAAYLSQKGIEVPSVFDGNTDEKCRQIGVNIWNVFVSLEGSDCIRENVFRQKYLQDLINLLPSGSVVRNEENKATTKANLLNDKQLEFVAARLSSYQTKVPGYVTRESFLGDLTTPLSSFFYWLYYSCEATAQNFGVEVTGSLWDFVIGYIGGDEADQILSNQKVPSHALILRYSTSEAQSIVIHIKSAGRKPMQRAPVKVGHNAESLARLLGNPLFTSDYVIFTYGSRGQLRIRPISEFHRLVRRRSAANNCIYPPPHAEKHEVIPFPLTEINQTTSQAATDLLDIIQRIQNSDGSKDCTLDPKVLKNFRQLILQTPELITLAERITTASAAAPNSDDHIADESLYL